MITSIPWLALGLFAVSAVGTPGPNNVMLTASGARHGYVRTLPHIAGIIIGSATLYFAVIAGLGALFQAWPPLQWTLRLAGGAYLLYLAWRIASAPPPRLDQHEHTRPLSFWEAAAFQYANPKVWVMGLTLGASFMPADGLLWRDATLLVLTMSVVGLPCLSFWTGFGRALAGLLRTDRAWHWFNRVMGALTAACLVFIFAD
ncbi:LysE family translocator [Salinisphaera sp. Q1T1-3]|uniref:LysE family translocator n=1 Tax=Salinisphaera sp. Q1T1-3 TaxID=2321229 RepID=UPI000E74E42A|nr:LysE family translocator [Salinisphaera sp. Q1T1-3]RJS93281.1 LysE family translocator [Salinisphaera sp. Q1T1-3]